MRKLVILVLALLSSLPTLSQDCKVYLIGDAGEPKFPEDKNLSFLSKQLESASESDVLIFLGDNIYPKGLPDEDHPEREAMEKKLNAQLDVMKAFKGKSYIIPGNHDWAKSKKQGWQNVLNQQRYVQKYLGSETAFQPIGGCPGPVEINVNESLTIVLLDLQFLLHNWDKPGEDSQCESKNATDVLLHLDEVIERNKSRHILVAAHHPMYTYGVHGGATTARDHLFPLTLINDGLYVPLPVLGSIYPAFRKYVGSLQDTNHPKVRALRARMIEIFNKAENVVYTNGHEHSLEYIKRDGMHFVVSGSGSKITKVRKGKYSEFAKEARGFAAVNFTAGGSADIEFWDGDSGTSLYKSALYQKQIVTDQEKIANRPDFRDQTIEVAASTAYKAGAFKRWMLGDNYRDVWATKIEVPVFDIETERGGLKILKKGGGMQTRSLRMEANNEKQYVLRSIEKYAENAIPAAIRKTFAADLVQDQISASHPYGALVVPYLADAVGIFHTNPKAVYIPEDPVFGPFTNTFAGLMAIYEERPNSKAASDPFFGAGEKVRSTFDVIDDLHDDNDNRVDQAFVVRNRLFDMWIGDWDRHDDQWRWVRYDDPDGKGHLYKPIPRDRDQAFFVNDGVLPKIVSRRWALPKVEGFDARVDWAPGLSNNARYFDRTFMSMPDWSVWEKEVDFLMASLTDEVIENSLKKWPEKIYKLTGPQIAADLKARRADMKRYAREHYLFLSREVEILGSDKDELFEVRRLDDERTSVVVYKLKKGKKDLKIYERTFLRSETKEIRLFGLSGQDEFDISGEVQKSIRVVVLGGRKKDKVSDQSNVRAGGKKTIIYDKAGAVKIDGGKETKVRLAKDNETNAYNRKSFKYDIMMPLLSAQLNPDDGLFLGLGFLYTKNHWRKPTFAAQHRFLMNAAFATGSYSFNYRGTFNDVVGKWGLRLDAESQAPFFVNNYFGLGNDTSFDFEGEGPASGEDNPIQFYRIRTDRSTYGASLFKNLGNSSVFSFGPVYRSARVDDSDRNFLLSPESDVNVDKVAQAHQYGGAHASLKLDSRDSKVITKQGTLFNLGIQRLWGINERSENLGYLTGNLSFYLTPRATNLTFANRVGVDHVIGDFEFFNAATLGGRTNLRGFRRTRFYGRTAFYNNTDLRLKLFSFRSYLFPAKLGLQAYHDIGRVWQDGEASDTLHRSVGFGLWIAPANATVIALNYSITDEENLIAVNFGFLF
ncbi:MAG: metallophosphoesterase [Bacteroidota bacterium]